MLSPKGRKTAIPITEGNYRRRSRNSRFHACDSSYFAAYLIKNIQENSYKETPKSIESRGYVNDGTHNCMK